MPSDCSGGFLSPGLGQNTPQKDVQEDLSDSAFAHAFSTQTHLVKTIAIHGSADMDDRAAKIKCFPKQLTEQLIRGWLEKHSLSRDSSWSSANLHPHIIKGILHVSSNEWIGMVKNGQEGQKRMHP